MHLHLDAVVLVFEMHVVIAHQFLFLLRQNPHRIKKLDDAFLAAFHINIYVAGLTDELVWIQYRICLTFEYDGFSAVVFKKFGKPLTFGIKIFVQASDFFGGGSPLHEHCKRRRGGRLHFSHAVEYYAEQRLLLGKFINLLPFLLRNLRWEFVADTQSIA